MGWSDPNVISAIVMFLATCLVMIMSVLFFPKIRLGKYKIDSYWVVTLVGAVIVLVAGLWDNPTPASCLKVWARDLWTTNPPSTP